MVSNKTQDGVRYLYPSLEQEEYTNLNIPFTGNLFIGFKEALAFKESEGNTKQLILFGIWGIPIWY
jgi:hypothetical protein